MNTHKFFFRRSFTIILAAVLMFVLSACSTENSRKTESYVTSVKTLVNDSVNNTRTLRTQYDEFNCKENESSNAYISTLETLSDLYGQLIKLESPDDYDDLDEQIKSNANEVLSIITELKTLVKYAVENADDSLYQKDKEELLNNYYEYYNTLTSLSSEVQTRFRNA